jgi:hypothetical protein
MLICMWTLPCLTPQQEAFMKRHPPSTIIQSGYSPHIDPISLAYLFFLGAQFEEPFNCKKRVTNTRRTTKGTPRQTTKRLRYNILEPVLGWPSGYCTKHCSKSLLKRDFIPFLSNYAHSSTSTCIFLPL